MKNFTILLILIINLLPVQTNSQNISIELNQNWQFKNQKENKWYKATVPGTVHTDLLANKLIPDPYYRDNESKLQWIDKADWEYKTIFDVDENIFAKNAIELFFDGLDTYVNVYLNGKLILQADNMFRSWKVNVKPFIERTGNVLLIKFASAQNKVDSIAKARLPLVLPDNNRVYVRKAQFQFGWDWGPKFVGCGVWKKIKLEGWDNIKIGAFSSYYNQEIKRLEFRYKIISLQGYMYTICLIDKELAIKRKINYKDLATLVKSNEILIKGNSTFTDFNSGTLVISPENLLQAKKQLQYSLVLFHQYHKGKIEFVEECKVNITLQNVKLIQQKDSIGTSFYFEKDGKPIYAKGANWIPGDVFLPGLKREDYRRMLLSAKEANMNMLRVWGGGVYESDDFYDLCDSLGIMVWQDFMFAGGMYPGDDAFMNNVREEVKYQIERLRNHPCIVLWCGNNEVEEAWKNWGWQNQFNLHGADSAKVWNDYRRLFQDSLKKWVDEFDGSRPYVSTSPKNGWGHKESFTEGDSHYWGVWWGLEDWETFEKKTGRFVSEYGMQAMPNWNTIKSFTDSSDRYLYSPVIQSHQKASDGFKKLNHYITRYFIDSARLSRLSLEDYTYLSQCMQYYVLKNSIATHRSKYPANMGTLLWQLNDCWPVTSWSITDYGRQPKAAWYAVKEAYRDDVMPVKDSVYPKDLQLQKPVFTFKPMGESSFSITCNVDACYVYLYAKNGNLIVSENYFNLKAGVSKQLNWPDRYFSMQQVSQIKIKSLYDILVK
jgi:beta-galactosidase/beta-glucuronidase